MLLSLKVFNHRPSDESEHTDAPAKPGNSGGAPILPLGFTLHPLAERRMKKRDECFRGLVELEAELLREVEREA